MPIDYPDWTGQIGALHTTNNIVTLSGAAITGYRTFGDAVTASKLTDTNQVYVLVEESDTKKALWLATFDDEATDTLTMNTLIDSIGTFTAGEATAVEAIVVGPGAMLTGIDRLDAIAGAANADVTLTAVNCRVTTDISGYDANRTVTLPATFAVDDIVEVFVSVGDDTYAQIIKPAAGDTIDGGSEAAEWSRLFIPGEKVRFRGVTANSAWTVDYDGRKPSGVIMYLSASTTGNTFTSGSYVQIPFNTEVEDIGSLGNTSTGTVTARRVGLYQVVASVAISAVTDLGAAPAADITESNKVIIAIRIQNSGSRVMSTPNAVLYSDDANQGWAVAGETKVTTAGHTLTAEFYNTDTNGIDLVGDTLANNGKTYFTVREVL